MTSVLLHWSRRPPRAFWGYVATIPLLLVATAVASAEASISWEGAVALILLLFGLGSGSQLCRWLLMLLSITGVLAVLALQTRFPLLLDSGLVAILVVQAALLCTPSMRAYAGDGPPRVF